MLQKALFFDIDGTIISEQTGRIPNSTIEALTRAKENGHLLFINSGRTRCSIPPVLLPMPFDGFLCGCGTELIYNGESFYHHTLSPDAVHSIIMDFINYDCDGLLEAVTLFIFRQPVPVFQRSNVSVIPLNSLALPKPTRPDPYSLINSYFSRTSAAIRCQ